MVAARLLHYLRLPLCPAPLILIAIFGILLNLAEHAGLLGVPALAILGSSFLTYGFALLDHVLEGRPEAPVLSYEMAQPLARRPLGTLLLLLCFYFLTDALRPWTGGTVIWMLRILLLAMIPAMVAAMSLSGRFFDGLNPTAVFTIIARIPSAYGFLLIGLAAMWFLAALLARASSPFYASLWQMDSMVPGQVYEAIGAKGSALALCGQMFFMYLWLTSFAWIGGAIYEQRLELDLEVAISPERTAARDQADQERRRDQIWDQIFAQARSGAWANARESLRQVIEESREPLAECRWLYARAADKSDQRLANHLARLTLPRLIAERATGEAVDLVRERLARDQDFRPQTAAQLLTLARLARDAGDRRTARQLLADFDKFFSNDPLQPAAAQLQRELQR